MKVFLIVMVADLVRYWTHRAHHEMPLLWRLHSVHHSVRSMDWLADSRQHIIELIITRTLVLAPIYKLGSSKEVIDAYILIVGFQAGFNHANGSVRLGPLRHVIITPNFHIGTTRRTMRPSTRTTLRTSLDHLLGKAVQSDQPWPAHCGVVGDYVPSGFWKRVAFPIH